MTYTKGMFQGKKITVMGLGLLGRGVGDVEFFAKEGAELIVTDLKPSTALRPSLEKLRKYKNIRYTLGKHKLEDFENRDFILKAAGVPLDSPYIAHAKKAGVPVYMSTALFASLTLGTIVGITGTRGKTTVTHMLYEILKRRYKKTKTNVFLGGNVPGMATLPLISKVKKGDLVVLELDSWQLQGFGDLQISPKVSVFTTFMPDHLNYYKGDLKTYFKDKSYIFANQKSKDFLIAGEQVCTLPKVFTKQFPRYTRFVSERALPRSVHLKVKGEHNAYNASIAFIAARALKVPQKTIVESLSSFTGVSGRLQKIVSTGGVDVYNDTTATTPEALKAALEALGKKNNILLIAGGSDKMIDLGLLREPIMQYVKEVFLISGTGTERLLKEGIIPKEIPAHSFSHFDALVKKVFQSKQAGDVILLSPGFASFGMFKNEYDRGEQFNSLVKKYNK